ncbi:DUF2993 domain-containing protein [Streptomyces sp. NPDC001388]|uniref:LmeA family phospholipid-binding protein n=1 Tax=Streptomyces sp. NPDC001388 TaxID=3364568 RepID=UPI00367730C9
MIRHVLGRYRTASVAVTALAVLLLAATVAEVAARGLLRGRMATAADRVLGDGSDVHVDGGPALLDLFDRHIDAVTVSSDHATVGRIPDVSVRARLDDIRLTGNASGTVARTQADVEIPAASLQSLAAGSGGRLPVSAVRLDDAADTLTLVLGRGGLGEATLRPQLQNGRVTLHLEDAEILGSPAPAGFVDRIQDGLSDRAGLDYPLGLKATSLDVTDTGLDVALTGGPTRLPAQDTAQ